VDRERIEDFLRRWLRRREVLAVAVAILLALLLSLRVLLGPLPRESSVDHKSEVVRACGREVLAEYRHLDEYPDIAGDLARGMRKDCGIYGPTAGD
jgi:hypothetical protein